MAAQACKRCKAPDSVPVDVPMRRNLLLRSLDAFAAWQIRQSYRVINRSHRRGPRMTSVVQPSSTSARSTTNPCER